MEQKARVILGLFEAAREAGVDLTKAAVEADMKESSLIRARERVKDGAIPDRYAHGLARATDPPMTDYDLWRKAIDWAEEHDDAPPRRRRRLLDGDEAPGA